MDKIQINNLTEIKERNDSIHKIAQDVKELNEIFEDLQTMVNDNSESIKILEDNIQVSKKNIEFAEQELENAEIQQKKLNKKYIILTSILCVSVGTPIGVFIGTKVAISAMVGIGLSGLIYKVI